MQRLFRLVIFITLSFATFTLRAQTDDAHSVQEARTVKYAARTLSASAPGHALPH